MGKFRVPLALPVPSSRDCFNTGKASATLFQQAVAWAARRGGVYTPGNDPLPVNGYPSHNRSQEDFG